MIAHLYKRKHMFAPWVLTWLVNNNQYTDTYRTKKEALEYASNMGFDVKED